MNMKLSRREILALGGSLPFLHLSNAFGFEALRKISSQNLAASNDNLMMIFNSIPDGHSGESDEFCTMQGVVESLEAMKIPKNRTLIGLGIRTGFANNPFAAPGEMAMAWDMTKPWEDVAVIGSNVDSSPVPFNKDDPMPFGFFGVLNPESAYKFQYGGPQDSGKVLWDFNQDDTTVPVIGLGFHNSFSHVDGGMMNELYKAAKDAKSQHFNWGDQKRRTKIQKYLYGADRNLDYTNISRTLGGGIIEKEWLPLLRRKGWKGAAVILRGRFQNVVQMHNTEWNHRYPGDGIFDGFNKGTGRPLGMKLKTEYKIYNEDTPAEWTQMGFIWDFETYPEILDWAHLADGFGHLYHFHGYREDGTRMGHTMMASLADSAIDVELYPLTFESGKTAIHVNDDLIATPINFKPGSSNVTVRVENKGWNSCRNVEVKLSQSNMVLSRAEIIPHLKPQSFEEVTFTNLAISPSTSFRIAVDSKKHFLEGGLKKANNKFVLYPNGTWKYL